MHGGPAVGSTDLGARSTEHFRGPRCGSQWVKIIFCDPTNEIQPDPDPTVHTHYWLKEGLLDAIHHEIGWLKTLPIENKR